MTDDEQNSGTQDIGGGPHEVAPDAIPRSDELETQCAEYLAGWKRALADYENLQRNNATLREDDRRRIRMNLAHELLPVVDNFEAAMKFAPAEVPDAMKNWFAGVSHIARQFADVLTSLGVTSIVTLDQPFDPNLHDSGGSKHVDGKEPNVIVEEVVRGYKIGDVVLRPAKVIVNE